MAYGIQHLYKYRGFSDRTLEVLRNKQLYFPTADKLNDPFEFEFSLTSNQINGSHIDPGSMAAAKQSMKQYGVLALGEAPDVVLMWSHYADEHKGLCLGFTRTDSNELGEYGKCFPVLYSEELPSFRPEQLTDPQHVGKALTTKADFWSYEREWRMISRDGGIAIDFPGELTSVTFGFRMPDDQRKKVVAILGDSVDYFETVIHPTKYRVDVAPIKHVKYA